MPIGQRPQRRNPQAPRLTFWPELESCPVCHHPLVSKGSAVHSHKTLQTLAGEFYVVAYSRRCTNPECNACGQHFHSGEHLKLSLPIVHLRSRCDCQHRYPTPARAQAIW